MDLINYLELKKLFYLQKKHLEVSLLVSSGKPPNPLFRLETERKSTNVVLSKAKNLSHLVKILRFTQDDAGKQIS